MSRNRVSRYPGVKSSSRRRCRLVQGRSQPRSRVHGAGSLLLKALGSSARQRDALVRTTTQARDPGWETLPFLGRARESISCIQKIQGREWRRSGTDLPAGIVGESRDLHPELGATGPWRSAFVETATTARAWPWGVLAVFASAGKLNGETFIHEFRAIFSGASPGQR